MYTDPRNYELPDSQSPVSSFLHFDELN
jgi:hypothetical protein